jgi:Zn finger protein HypA/HybF involved in hydrogenase expression
MTREKFVQCVDCDRIYTAVRDEDGTLHSTESAGCPECGGTDVTIITG